MLLKIYGGKETTCAEARAAKWRKMKKKRLARRPPDKGTLHHYLDRVNYLSYLLKHYEQNFHLSPIGSGWQHINGKCRPVRYPVPTTGDVLQPQPQALSDDYNVDGSNG